MKRLLLRTAAVMLAVSIVPAARASAQNLAPGDAGSEPPAAKQGPERPSPNTTPYPVDILRVQEAAQRIPAVKLDDSKLKFYALVIAPKEENFVEKFAKDYDFRNGPTRRGAAMTHNEFMSMVTPKELNELFGYTNGSTFAMLQAALVNAGGQALIKKAIKEIREARNAREIHAIRERIDRELNALLGKDR
jgi:hypothetical protein